MFLNERIAQDGLIVVAVTVICLLPILIMPPILKFYAKQLGDNVEPPRLLVILIVEEPMLVIVVFGIYVREQLLFVKTESVWRQLVYPFPHRLVPVQ